MATSTAPPTKEPRPPSGRSPAPRSTTSRRQAWSSRWHALDMRAAPYAYIAPFFVLFGAFGLYPLIYTGWVSLHRVDLGSTEMEWLGLENYTALVQDELFWNALWNTFTLGVLSTVPQLLMALGIAHLLNYRLRGSIFFRVAALTPYATSVAASALIFSLLFSPGDEAVMNWFLGLVGIDAVDWENGDLTAQIAISVIVTWRWTGYNALLYLAAMQAISRDLYEASAIDGASRWQQFRQVTIPGIRPTIVFTVVLSTIGATQLFGEPLIFGGAAGASGGINNQYQTLGLLLYENGWTYGHLGRGAAIAWLMFLILLIVFALNALVSRRLRRS
ncbi:carbohydrate ABC transporter permease [Allostreptomyces psammosilenae]|uniref:Cellobiose transport system permease protein n=1 Tax=Allostreptomyces psammosilenae TaxID=1892865 RepID=A0A852ZQP9_9ACTN|nr:sugar ABC transporter permease [Allostreptomyces psammosilenae]NYI03610.1 cellobiose transport system permease protein [Allostreptomyces psammosilenae]